MNALKSKTMWFSFGLVAVGFIEQNVGILDAVVPMEYRGAALAAVGLVSALLRLKTTEAIKDK